MSHQSILVRITADTSRAVREYLTGVPTSYSSLSEFVEVALLNQLALENERTEDAAKTIGPGSTRHGNGNKEGMHRFLGTPDEEPQGRLVVFSPDQAEALSPFTNRLAPIKVAARVLANMANMGWPPLEEFQVAAADAARRLGKRLQRDGDNRATGFPVGADPRKSARRFISSFTIVQMGGRWTGPLAILGLAHIEKGRVALTERGWQLAIAPSPLLGETAPSGTLSPEEIRLFLQGVRASLAECAAVDEFVRLIERCHGRQADLDKALRAAREVWTDEMTVAQRAAMLGRLKDLRLVEVEGRGTAAIIRLTHGDNAMQVNTP